MAEVEGHGIGSAQVTQNAALVKGIDVFEGIMIEDSIRRCKEAVYLPMSQLRNEGPYHFKVPSQGNQYTQLGSLRLYGRCCICRADGKQIDANIGVINNFPSSLFESIEVLLNGEIVTPLGSKGSSYVDYIETVLSMGGDARRGHLASVMFSMDEADKFDTAGDNKGFANLHGRVKNGESFDWIIPVNADLLRSNRVLPPRNEIVITFNRNKDEFSLIGDKEKVFKSGYKIKIEDLKLYVRMLEVDPSVLAFHMKGWAERPLIYPINRTVLRHYMIGAAVETYTTSAVFPNGQLPKSVVVGMVKTSAFLGNTFESPWNFQHFRCSKINLRVKNDNVPHYPYKPNFMSGLIAREYEGLFQNSGIRNSTEGNCITRDLFKGGCFLSVFDLTPDFCNGYHAHPTEKGDLVVDVDFAAPLDAPITMIIYCVFDSEVSITMDLNVTMHGVHGR